MDPKIKKIKKLKKRKNRNFAEQILNPQDEIMNLDLLILGHPRSGTGYMAKLFSSFGIDIGHEFIGKNGISCWTFLIPNANHMHGQDMSIKDKSRQNFTFNHVVQCVRNPINCINSVFFSESGEKSHSRIFRSKYNSYIDQSDPLIDQVICSITGWNKMIEDLNPSATFKIENCESEVKKFVCMEMDFSNLITSESNLPPKNYNARKHDKLTYEEIKKMALPKSLSLLDEYCDKYQYSL